MKSDKEHFLIFVIAALFIFSISGCTTVYVGDSLLELAENPQDPEADKEITRKAIEIIPSLLDRFELSRKQKSALKKIKPIKIYRINRDEHPIIDNALIIGNQETSLAKVMNSIIICPGSLHIAHSDNNIAVCGSDIDIDFDGAAGAGSLLISKGEIKIAFGNYTSLYALQGSAYNTASPYFGGYPAAGRCTSEKFIDSVFKDEIPGHQESSCQNPKPQLIATGRNVGTPITGIITKVRGKIYTSRKHDPYNGKLMYACRASAKYSVNKSKVSRMFDYEKEWEDIKIQDGETGLVEWVIRNPDSFKCKPGNKFVGFIYKIQSNSKMIEAYTIANGIKDTENNNSGNIK